jgi:hypothetical protein
MPETSSEEGLTVIYDEETLTFSFDWDPETHPEYNFLQDMTSNDLIKMITDYLELTDEEAKQKHAEVLTRGQSGRAS